jgi:hypothetical protein
MEFTNSLTEHLQTQGLLDENTVRDFTQAYYEQENASSLNDSENFEQTAIFTLTCFLK